MVAGDLLLMWLMMWLVLLVLVLLVLVLVSVLVLVLLVQLVLLMRLARNASRTLYPAATHVQHGVMSHGHIGYVLIDWLYVAPVR